MRRTYWRTVLVMITAIAPATLSAQALTYRLNFTWPAFYEVLGPGSVASTPSVGPKGALFQIITSDVDNGTKMDVAFTEIPTMSQAELIAALRDAPLNGKASSAGMSIRVVAKRSSDVDKNKLYRVAKADLPPEFYTLEKGPDIGTLAVPFRLQLRDGALTAGSTLGFYLGYRQRWLKWPSTLLGSLGLAIVPTAPAQANGQPADIDNTTALSGAVGLVFEPLPQVQFGLVLGVDHTGKKQDYRYENRPWMTLAIGFGFIRR